jgi:hypothetical protein
MLNQVGKRLVMLGSGAVRTQQSDYNILCYDSLKGVEKGAVILPLPRPILSIKAKRWG